MNQTPDRFSFDLTRTFPFYKKTRVGNDVIRSYAGLCAIVFALALFARSPGLFTSPRFWAEEAWYYIPYMEKKPLRGIFTFAYNNNYQFLTNLFSSAAAMLPARLSAYATTYLGFVVALYAAILLGMFAREVNASRRALALAGVAFAFQPAGYEVFLSTTNVQWVCAISVLLLAFLDLERHSSAFFVANALWVLCCGLTGVPSAILAPLMLVVAIVRQSRRHLVLAGLLACAAVIGLIVLHRSHQPSLRPFSLSPRIIVPLLLQTIDVHLLGMQWTTIIGEQIQKSSDSIPAGAIPMLVFPVFLAAYLMLSSGDNMRRSALVVLAWVYVTCLYTFGSFDGLEKLVSGWYGARYFMFGSMCFVLVILIVEGAGRLRGRMFAQGLLLIVVTASLCDWYTGAFTHLFLNGPVVSEQVVSCGERRPCPVTAWPDGDPRNPVMLNQP